MGEEKLGTVPVSSPLSFRGRRAGWIDSDHRQGAAPPFDLRRLAGPSRASEGHGQSSGADAASARQRPLSPHEREREGRTTRPAATTSPAADETGRGSASSSDQDTDDDAARRATAEIAVSPPPHDKKLHHMERVPAENQKRRKKSQSDSSLHTDDEMDEDDLTLFQVVADDLRVKSTVGWQNAVKSLTTALNHVDREESQRFLEYAFGRVVSIMLDQHSSKIGPVEKSCVTQTLAASIPLIVAQLKSGRYAQVLPILVMVFNKKRTFYKDLRTSAMMGSYWNKVGGAPEVRAQCIAAFCELKGFNLLLDTLEVIMKTLDSESANEAKDDSAVTSMDLLNIDDIRILLQALLDFRTATPDDVISRLCTLVMTYFVRVPEPLLKRDSTDAIGAVIAIVRRFVDANVVPATEINALWLDLTLRYVQSSSLPLRLFGLEQVGQIVNCARASRAFPPRYLVRSAGTQAVNGVYTLKPDSSGATYVLKKEDTGQVFTLFCCTMKSGLKWWFISEADKMQPGSDQDVDYYQHQSQFEEYLPPSNHWMPIGKGEAPPPELIPEPVREDENVESFDPTRFDHVLGEWVIEKQITETIFGDRIHREVVSRSASLIKFLAESNKLSEYALDIIWCSCLQKDKALVDEIHNLLISTVPFLSDALVLRLVDQINGTLEKKLVKNENITETISFLERLSTAAPAFFHEKSQSITDQVLRLLWSIQRTEMGSSAKAGSPQRLSRSLREFFQGGLRSEHGEIRRKDFLTECLDVIKNSCLLHDSLSASIPGTMSASSSLELLKFLIDSYGVEMPVVIESLNRDHDLVGLLFDELSAFVNRSQEKASSVEDTSYQTAIGHRLELIHYIHVKCPMLELSVEQIMRLWGILSSSSIERECCLAFFNHAHYSNTSPSDSAVDTGFVASGVSIGISSAFSVDVRRFIFNELLCQQTDFSCLGSLGYHCFHSYFVGVNDEVLRSSHETISSIQIGNIIGIDALWRIAFDSPVGVAKPASDELLRVYRGVCSRGAVDSSARCVKDFLHRILTHLEAVNSASEDALRRVQQATQLLNGFVDGSTQPDQEDSTQSEQRISPTLSHGKSGRGAMFKIKVVAQRIPGAGGVVNAQENAFRAFHTSVFANMILAHLRKQLEELVGHPIQQTKLLCAGAALSGERKTLSDLRITDTSEVRVLMFNSVVQRPLSPDADQAMEVSENSTSTSVGGLIAQDAEYFEVLFRVLDAVAAHPSVHKSLWDLLNKLPTNVQLLTKITRMGGISARAAVLDDSDGDAQMQSNSPPSTAQEADVKTEWLSLLGDSSHNKPIYILQIVDSLLLPSDTSKADFAQAYKEAFVSDGGFDAVLQYFLGADVRSSLFNEGAAVALRILRSCLFDSKLGYDDVEEVAVSLNVGEKSAEQLNHVRVMEKDYVRLALKIADLVVAEYSPAVNALDHTTSESERILIDALKTVRSIVRIEKEAARAYMKSQSLSGDLMASILMECPNEQVREQWLLSIQAVLHAAPSTLDDEESSTAVIVFERMIASLQRIEEITVPCDQYFRLLRFLVQEDNLVDYCSALARKVLSKIRSGFSSKFLASNDRSNEVLTGCLEFLRDVLVHQVGLRSELAREMIEVVYDDCLFTLPTAERRRCPLCVSTETRRPAFKLLATAISSYAPIILDLQQRLTRLFTRTEGAQQAQQLKWGQENSVETRRNGEHVGLKNQGCSCYMNSFLQQIFMHPSLRYGLLGAKVPPRLTPVEPTKVEAEQNPERLVGCRIALECMNGRVYEAAVTGYEEASRRHRVRYDDGNEASFVLSEGRPGNENGRYAIMQTELTGLEATLEVLRQVQRTFCYLQDSEMRYFNPRALVDSCKCLNLEFSVYQQNDASEFCDKLLDRLETGLKNTPQGAKCLAHALGGKLISQKLPQDCGHRYEREEPFIRLELQIRGKESIEESLSSFVEGELMDGDNKVECELCGTKKAAVRRTCFGALPNFLILHLKRFDLDYTTFETVKLNNRCSFPMKLNMKPYTKEGLEERETSKGGGVVPSPTESSEEQIDNVVADDDVDMNENAERDMPPNLCEAEVDDRSYEYRLKGVLVHSGVAQGGHYYSFIFDHVSEKWFKYDDEDVSPFDPENIEAECFGGVQRRTWHGSSNSVEMEVFSNALMLFYEKVEPVDTEYTESLAQAAAHGTGSPYEAEVWRANEVFLQNSYVLDVEFHEFLREMVQSKYLKDQPPAHALTGIESARLHPPSPPVQETVAATNSTLASDESIQTTLAQIGIEFVLSVLLHSREKHGIARWITVLASKFAKYKTICAQYFEVLSTAPKQIEWTRSILFESPDSISRQSFVHLTSRALAAYEMHMKTAETSPVDVDVLNRFLDVLVEFLDQTPVLQQTHLEECFMLIRNCAENSRILRDGMRRRDMIARLVNCFLGERSPNALKEAFPSTHQFRTSNRFASPDFQHLLEAIIAILGFPRRCTEALVNESNTHYPHRVTLSEKAELALTSVFEEYQNQERGSLSSEDLQKYLSVCMSCSIATPAVQQKAQGILAKYGRQVPASPASSSPPSELELDGFLTYYTDAAAAASKNVYQDLRAHGFGDDLKRREDALVALEGDNGLNGLSELSCEALLNEVFFDSALEEDAETAGDMLLRVVDGNLSASTLLLRSLLQCMASTETGWKGQPIVDTCSQMLQTLLSRGSEHRDDMIEMAMIHPEFGLLATAESRERVRQRYANSNLVPLFVYRQIVALVDLHHKIPAVATWLAAHRRHWEWMYEWLRLESLRPSLGGRLAVLYREPGKLEILCRLGEALDIPYLEEERHYIVEGAGYESVNGVYKSTSQLHDNCTIYTCAKDDIEYTLFRCSMPSKARRWYISYSPNKSLLGTVSDEDFYFVPCHIDDDSPPETGWRVWTKNEKAQAPSPSVRLLMSSVASDSPAAQRLSPVEGVFGAEMDCGEGDVDADADTVEYDDSEDEIRVSNERFQAVHLDNQDESDRPQSPTTDDFM